MMAFDGVFLSAMVREIRQKAIGARVDKVYQPTREEIILFLRGVNCNEKLLLSARSTGARIQLTGLNVENPPVPPMLCMLLRKCLVGARLAKIEQSGAERIVTLTFDAHNEFGDEISLHLIAELMGRNANLILTDGEDKVIDCVRRTDATGVMRILLPGVRYEAPPVAPGRADVLLTDAQTVAQRVLSYDAPDRFTALLETTAGFSPAVCREVIARWEKAEKADGAALAEELRRAIEFSHDPVPTLAQYGSGKTDFSFLPMSAGVSGSPRTFETLSALLDTYYGERELRERMRQKSNELSKWLSNAVARVRRRVASQRQDLQATENREQWRQYGELLKANLHRICPGDTVCEVINYYSEACDTVCIPLDPALNPNQNAQRYFKEYRKAVNAQDILAQQIRAGERELEYLESVVLELENACSDGDLNEIRAELTEAGYRKPSRTREKVRRVAGTPLEYRSSDGLRILVGRNNHQNDELTLKMASGRDYWFHVKHIPGAHVILFTDGAQPPERSLDEAARIAAAHSKGVDGAPVEVDYLPAKRVKKPNGARPGMVIYENYQTVYIVVDRESVKHLKIQ